MLTAFARKGFPAPAGPPFNQSQSCELRHEVELCRPYISEGNRGVVTATIEDLDIVRSHRLRDDVVDIKRPLRRAHVKRHDGLPRRKAAQIWDSDLNDETAIGLKVRGDVAEARNLGFLSREIHDRVEDQVRDGERPIHTRRREVADRDTDGVAARLGAQPSDHSGRELDAMNRNAAARQRKCDAPGADAKFQGAAAAREIRQHINCWFHEGGLEHVRGRLVVRRRDPFSKIAILVFHERTVLRPPLHIPTLVRDITGCSATLASMPVLHLAEVLADVMRRDAAGTGIRILAVDGPSGSGKSTLAMRLAAWSGAPLIQIDDFVSWSDFAGWWPRLERQVLTPLLSGLHARYQVRDWANDEFGTSLNGWKTTEWSPLVILEGVTCTRLAAADRLAYRIWVDAPDDLRLRRGMERDGESHRQLWLDWMTEERQFFADDGTSARADLRVTGQPDATHDQETQIMLLE
jgi:hypothetical protein